MRCMGDGLEGVVGTRDSTFIEALKGASKMDNPRFIARFGIRPFLPLSAWTSPVPSGILPH